MPEPKGVDKNASYGERRTSVPEDNPNDDEALREALRTQIRPTNCILVISGMYVAYSDWIQHEIGVADVMVGWYTPSIIREIRKRTL